MLWGAVSRDFTGLITTIEGTMNAIKYCEILERHMLLHFQEKMEHGCIFQQDYDPKHTSRLARKFLSDHGVQVLEWPPQSPDLNPIGNLWQLVDREVKKKTIKFAAVRRNCKIRMGKCVP